MNRTTKYDLPSSRKYRTVACHIETLHSSNSSTVHITQLGCSCFPSNPDTETTSSLFRAGLVPGLNKYLDTCRLSGNLLQALHITREDDGTNFTYIFSVPSCACSHPALLEVLGRLFYHGELLLYADKVIVNSCLQFPSLTKQAKGQVPLIFRLRFCLVFGLNFIFCCSGGLWGRI